MNALIGLYLPGDLRLKNLLKLWPVRIIVLGWLVMAISIAMSIAQTGNFLFEYGPNSGRPEIITPYFKVVAISLLVQIIVVASSLVLIRLQKKA